MAYLTPKAERIKAHIDGGWGAEAPGCRQPQEGWGQWKIRDLGAVASAPSPSPRRLCEHKYKHKLGDEGRRKTQGISGTLLWAHRTDPRGGAPGWSHTATPGDPRLLNIPSQSPTVGDSLFTIKKKNWVILHRSTRNCLVGNNNYLHSTKPGCRLHLHIYSGVRGTDPPWRQLKALAPLQRKAGWKEVNQRKGKGGAQLTSGSGEDWRASQVPNRARGRCWHRWPAGSRSWNGAECTPACRSCVPGSQHWGGHACSQRPAGRHPWACPSPASSWVTHGPG